MQVKSLLHESKKPEELKNGILNLSGIRFTSPDQVLEVSDFISKKNLHTLQLNDCTLCTVFSIRNSFLYDSSDRFTLLSSPNSSTKLKALVDTKAKATAQLISQQQWTVIDVSVNNLTALESTSLLEAISKQTQLRSLNFGHNLLGAKGAELLANYIGSFSRVGSLKYLKLAGCIDLKNNFQRLKIALQKNSTIRELDLSGIQLSAENLEDILEILTLNTTLTEISISGGSNPKLIDAIQEKLRINRQSRNQLHKNLLSSEKLLGQAKMALFDDNVQLLEVLMGAEKASTEEINFNKKQLATFKHLRKLSLRTNILIEQHGFLQKLANTKFKNDDELQKHNNALIQLLEQSGKAEMDITEEHLSRVALDLVNDQLVPLTEERRQEIKNEFLDTIKSVLASSNLTLTKESDINELIAQYALKVKMSEDEVGRIQKEHEQIQLDHIKYNKKRQRLLKILPTLTSDLNQYLKNEFEEIFEKVIEVNLDPNSIIDAEDNTLFLKCFLFNKPNCFKFLLHNGGDIYKRNSKGESVFSLLVSQPTTECHKILIHYIQEFLNKLWFKVHKCPQEKQLEEIKLALDRYLNVLIKNNQKSKIKQLLTGASLCLKGRNKELEDYYQYFQSIISKKELGTRSLFQMKGVATQAERGLLRQSQLHDEVLQSLDPLIENISLEEAKSKMQKMQSEFEKHPPKEESDDEKLTLLSDWETVDVIKVTKPDDFFSKLFIKFNGIITKESGNRTMIINVEELEKEQLGQGIKTK